MDRVALTNLIALYKSDPESVYNTWFVGGEERMKAFRAIRRGVRDTVDSIVTGTFGNDFKGSPSWNNVGVSYKKIYAVQTSPSVVERCILMATDPGDLVLDPTCGSGTTAYIAEQWGRRWITIDTSRVSIALARTRLMSGRYPYYLLADSAEGRKKEAEVSPHPAFGTQRSGKSVTNRFPTLQRRLIRRHLYCRRVIKLSDTIPVTVQRPLHELLRDRRNLLPILGFQAD